MSQIEKDIAVVLTGLMDAAKAERQEKRAELISELKAIKERDSNRFWTAIIGNLMGLVLAKVVERDDFSKRKI